jgi:hypothetical protein
MAVLIGKFSRNGTNYYFDYSTESKEPSMAMELAEYRAHYSKAHGRVALAKLGERLERADAKGTSGRMRRDLDDMLKGNKAGEGQSELTTDAVIDLLLMRRSTAVPAT